MRAALLTAGVVAAVWLLHPWTVRPIDEPAAPSGSAAIDPAVFAADLWRTSLMAAVTASAVDARTLLDALAASPADAQQRFGRADGSGSWYVAVRGLGRIASVNRESSRGVATVDVPPYDGRPDLSLQIGPIIGGSGLRDVTTLAPFSQFTNQLLYADVANALNARAEAAVLWPIRPALAAGQVVTFVAVAGRDVTAGGPLSDLVPVQLTIEGGRRE